MRFAAWMFVVLASACVVGVFLPAGKIHLEGPKLTIGSRSIGPSVALRGSLSLYQLSKSQESVRQLLSKYRDSTAKNVGAVVLAKVAPHLKGRAKAGASDVQRVIDTLDSIKDDDLELVSVITKVTLWSLLGLQAVIAILIFGVTTGTSRARVNGALVASLFGATIGVAIFVVLQRVAAEVNGELYAEIRRSPVSLQVGAYLIPIAAVGTAVSMIWLLIAHLGARRALVSAANRS